MMKVSVACESCIRCKRKCSGVHPCERCETKNIDCVFADLNTRKRRGPKPKSGNEEGPNMVIRTHGTASSDVIDAFFAIIRSRNVLKPYSTSDPTQTGSFFSQTNSSIGYMSSSPLVQSFAPHLQPYFYGLEVPTSIVRPDARFLMVSILANGLMCAKDFETAQRFARENEYALMEMSRYNVEIGMGILVLAQFYKTCGDYATARDLGNKNLECLDSFLTNFDPTEILHPKSKYMAQVRFLVIVSSIMMLSWGTPSEIVDHRKRLMQIPLNVVEQALVMIYDVGMGSMVGLSERLHDMEQKLMDARKDAASGNTSQWDNQSQTWKFPVGIYNCYELASKVTRAVGISMKSGNNYGEMMSMLTEISDHLATQDHSAHLTRLYFYMLDSVVKLCLCCGEVDRAREMMAHMELTRDITPDHQTKYAHLESLFENVPAQPHCGVKVSQHDVVQLVIKEETMLHQIPDPSMPILMVDPIDHELDFNRISDGTTLLEPSTAFGGR
eukprot:TRINITY_DN513_c0_g1_i1.p1 TRINITY_DN513_c0_g1~~TRINITY_DN513_c0_g1_i1.p1  ORF type:complete len:499 (+),score=80.46 TRINITY_DN513_c0_g1_i1:140-1636(+)